MRTATRFQLPSAWLQTAAPHSGSQFRAGARSEDRASLRLKSNASAQGGNAAGLVGAVIGEGKTCQRPMPGIPGGAWSVGPHATQYFWLLKLLERQMSTTHCLHLECKQGIQMIHNINALVTALNLRAMLPGDASYEVQWQENRDIKTCNSDKSLREIHATYCNVEQSSSRFSVLLHNQSVGHSNAKELGLSP